jgi:GntR family transcriptional regulator
VLARGRRRRELANILTEQIHTAAWPTGSKIPAERELARRYAVSRQTVRAALAELQRSGLLIRRHGSGTYVAGRRLEQSLLGHFSLVGSLYGDAAQVATVVLSRQTTRARPAIAGELGLRPGAEVFALQRLRTVAGGPFMLERTWLPAMMLPGLAQAESIGADLYATLRNRYGIVLVRAVESLEPVLLRPDEADCLDDTPGRPALLLLRTAFDAADRPIETSRAIVRADRCRSLLRRRLHEPDRP